MNFKLPDPKLVSLRAYLLSKLGLSYTEKHDKLLLRKIDDASTAFEFNNTTEFIDWLLSSQLNREQLGKLATYLTIGETYFFREKKSFDFLEQIYLPGLISKRYETERRIRIWCAGTASGEEAYSLAIALNQCIPDIHRWNISILATDINPVFLDKARKGIYTRWSFRSSSVEFINKYFKRVGANEFHILPEIRKMVKFELLNLAQDNYPSAENKTQAFDIIFCRNVLIYFSPEGTRHVTERFYKSLVDGGILIVSPVEMSHLISQRFSKIIYSGYTIYQKDKNRIESGKVENKPNSAASTDEIISSGIAFRNTQPIVINHNSSGETLNPTLFDSSFEMLESTKEYLQKELFQESKSAPSNKDSFNPDEVFFLQAKSKANQGKLQEAKELCEAGIASDKLDADLYYLLATVLQEQGNDAGAITALKMALYIRHDFVLAYFLLGNLELKAGNPAAGKKSFKNALISLSKYTPDDILPDSDGLTVGKFQEMLAAMIS
ncbi:MAG: CheR family methyltransferase [Bacteroidales bacterium]